jgi:hypothetical protein
LKIVLDDLQAGEGMPSSLLKNEQWPAGVSNIARNLSITSNKLDQLRRWVLIGKQQVPATNAAPVGFVVSPQHTS